MTNTKTLSVNENMMMLRLFKACKIVETYPASPSKTLIDCVKQGFVPVTRDGVILEYISEPTFDMITEEYGAEAFAVQANQTFHKSFSTVAETDIFTLVAQQILHYWSTYGMEAFGLGSANYVPAEKLEIPENTLRVKKLTVIACVPFNTCVEIIDDYAESVRAPSPEIIRYFTPLMHYITIPTDDIKSFELQVIKHDMDGTVPSNPISVLRYLVYKTTGTTLLIKNKRLRQSIINSVNRHGEMAWTILSRADEASLARIFFRYKPIFLAFKTHKDCGPIINRVRRLADIYHQPLPDVTVQNVTKLINDNRLADVYGIIAHASNRDLVKLGNAMRFRIKLYNKGEDHPSIIAVRNGRVYVKTDGFAPVNIDRYMTIYRAIVEQLRNNLLPLYEDKIFLMPDYMEYAIPTTEKQFTGNIPWGSKVLAPEGAFTVGIHWFNQAGRTDIDLHMNSATEHFGWNAGYRSDDRTVIYSGDITDAPEPNGGAEAYYFNPKDDKFILNARLFSSGTKKTEFKMFMTEVPVNANANRNRNYTFNPNDALFTPIPLTFDGDSSSKNLGLFDGREFYFYGGALDTGIVPRANYGDFIDGLAFQLGSKWKLNTLLDDIGATVVTNIDDVAEEDRDKVIDLTPEALTAGVMLKVIDGTL